VSERRAAARCAAALLALLFVLAQGGLARADEPGDDEQRRSPSGTPAPDPPPDDARGLSEPAPTAPEEVGLALPRLVLTPPRVVIGLLFGSLRHGMRLAERNGVGTLDPGAVSDDDGALAVYPALAHESGLGPTIGLRVRHDGIGDSGEAITADARFFGRYRHAYRLAFEGDRVLGSRLWLETSSAWQDDPHLLFAGVGDLPSAPTGTNLSPRQASIHTRMRRSGSLSMVRSGYTIGGGDHHLVKLGGTASFDNRKLEGSDQGPSIETRYDPRRLPGFGERTRTVELAANVIVDTRDRPGKTASGVYADLFAGGVPGTESRYFHYGGDARAFVNLYARDRVLVFRATHDAIVTNDPDALPIVALPELGGPERLRGYERGRFRDLKDISASIEYRYPIHEVLAGLLFIDSGAVGRDYSSLGRADRWHFGGGGGFLLRDRMRSLASIQVAYGELLCVYLTTEPFKVFSNRSLL
jgi:hypothetical protein